MWVACVLWGTHMFIVNLLDESQVCSCSLGIIHRSPFYPGGATGSWWSGSAKTPNWRRRSAAARSQRGQMPLLMYHVFQAGQQCVCVWAEVGGERTERLPRLSHIDANLTHAWVLPMVCVTLSASLTDLWGVRFFSFSQMQSDAKMGVGACLRPSCPSVATLFRVVFSEHCAGSTPLQQNVGFCFLLPSFCYDNNCSSCWELSLLLSWHTNMYVMLLLFWSSTLHPSLHECE